MDFEEYLKKGKFIYQKLIEFLDDTENSADNFYELNNIIDSQSIRESKEDLNAFLHLIVSISNNHHRSQGFFDKIEQILKLFQTEIPKIFTNYEIFNIFKSNKRILLFLFKEELIKFNESLANTLSTGWYKKANYHFYFYPEIEKFLNEKKLKKMSNKISEMNEVNSPDFEENRKIGENGYYICKLIQQDEIEDFVIYINKNNYSISRPINHSIFETNSYLLNNEMTLIEYAIFYGSIQIFKYLVLNNVELSHLAWISSIHGRNPEIIHSLEGYQIVPFDDVYQQCFYESIKCHHNELAFYIQTNLLNKNENYSSNAIKHYNYEYFPTDKIDEIGFYFACKNNDVYIVNHILNNSPTFDINKIFTDGNVQQTALSASIRERNKDIVEFLLTKQNIDVNIKSYLLIEGLDDDDDDDDNDCENADYEAVQSYKIEKSPLHIAVENEDDEIVDLLLSNPNIDVNACLDYYDKTQSSMHHIEKTALSMAIEKGNEKIVKLLLNNPNINVNFISKHNDGDYGSKKGHDRFIEKVPLIIAIENENFEIVKMLLNHPKIDVNIKSRYHDYKYIKFSGYRGNQYKEKTALSLAIEKNNLEILKLLLEHSELELNYRLLFYNSNHENQDEKKYKTNYYIFKDDFDGDDNDEIKFEKIRVYKVIQQELFQFKEIEPKMIFSRSFIKEMKTPLFISVENQNVDIVRILLSCPKIDVNYTSRIKSVEISDEISPLKKAEEEKNSEIIQMLKDHDAVEIKSRFRDELDLII